MRIASSTPRASVSTSACSASELATNSAESAGFADRKPDRSARLGTEHARADRDAMAGLSGAIGKSVEGRQHVELDVRLTGPGGVDEAAGLDDRRRQQSRFGQHVLQHVRGRAQALVLAEYRDRVLDLALNGRFQMVLIVFADARQVRDNVDPVLTQMSGRSNAGELQDFRRGESSRGQDDLPPRLDDRAIVEQDAACSFAVEHHLVDARRGPDRQIGTGLGFSQECLGSAAATSLPGGASDRSRRPPAERPLKSSL